jgi:creatinine amidohydrolase
MTASRPYILSELNYADVKAGEYEVAVLPFGATEPHNLHLPYGTDWFEGTLMGEAICARAHEMGAKVLLLPTIPYGVENNMRECRLAMNVQQATLNLLVTDLVDSLVNHGIRKIVLLNSHGGNEWKPLLRDLHGRTPARLFLCNWFKVLDDVYGSIFDQKDDHAGEMETSLILAWRPELVAKKRDGSLAADPGAVNASRFEAVNKGWVSITRPWHLLTTNTGSGNPHGATAEKGRRAVELIVQRLAPFLKELSDAEIDERFPF